MRIDARDHTASSCWSRTLFVVSTCQLYSRSVSERCYRSTKSSLAVSLLQGKCPVMVSGQFYQIIRNLGNPDRSSSDQRDPTALLLTAEHTVGAAAEALRSDDLRPVLEPRRARDRQRPQLPSRHEHELPGPVLRAAVERHRQLHQTLSISGQYRVLLVLLVVAVRRQARRRVPKVLRHLHRQRRRLQFLLVLDAPDYPSGNCNRVDNTIRLCPNILSTSLLYTLVRKINLNGL